MRIVFLLKLWLRAVGRAVGCFGHFELSGGSRSGINVSAILSHAHVQRVNLFIGARFQVVALMQMICLTGCAIAHTFLSFSVFLAPSELQLTSLHLNHHKPLKQ